jgi:hypothetical protein
MMQPSSSALVGCWFILTLLRFHTYNSEVDERLGKIGVVPNAMAPISFAFRKPHWVNASAIEQRM